MKQSDKINTLKNRQTKSQIGTRVELSDSPFMLQRCGKRWMSQSNYSFQEFVATYPLVIKGDIRPSSLQKQLDKGSWLETSLLTPMRKTIANMAASVVFINEALDQYQI